MKITIWVYDTGFGLGFKGTVTDQNLDMTKHGYLEIEELDLAISEQECFKLLEADAEERKDIRRAKLIAQLEALDNE